MTKSTQIPLVHSGAEPHADMAMNQHSGLAFISAERGDLEFERARRHSLIVRLLKVALPAIGILVILLIAGALLFRNYMLPEINIGSIQTENGKLVMENPQLSGLDSKKRPYKLSADRAIQDASKPSVVELEKLIATLPISDKVSAEIQAGNGIYDADAKTLVLSETVEVNSNDGMYVLLKDANVDIDKGTLRTSSSIQATSAKADISSSSLKVDEAGKRMVFEGNVRITLRPKEFRSNSDDQ